MKDADLGSVATVCSSCEHCGEKPTIYRDDIGLWDCAHICRGIDGFQGALNYQTKQAAIAAWNEVQKRKREKQNNSQ